MDPEKGRLAEELMAETSLEGFFRHQSDVGSKQIGQNPQQDVFRLELFLTQRRL